MLARHHQLAKFPRPINPFNLSRCYPATGPSRPSGGKGGNPPNSDGFVLNQQALHRGLDATAAFAAKQRGHPLAAKPATCNLQPATCLPAYLLTCYLNRPIRDHRVGDLNKASDVGTGNIIDVIVGQLAV